MKIAVLGSGAFGTALAVALARDGRDVTLWARDAAKARTMDSTRAAPALPGVTLPPELRVTSAPQSAAEVILLAVPMQSLAAALRDHAELWPGKHLVACCKGVELGTGRLTDTVMQDEAPKASFALLSGPSFAVDIAAGLPTALTLAAPDEAQARGLQELLSTPVLRIYRSTDMTGVALGGALKNVIAIASGMAMGAGLGESARAALMTRGYAEIQRLARARGARVETLAGLAGFGDLVLTCTSGKSRNYAYGLRLGQSGQTGATATTEGIATARAAAQLAERDRIDMPITAAIAAVLDGRWSVHQAAEALLSRPLRSE